ncbi:hypothetical protein NM208_g13790 [Fusarium decemcellulare]|uniref:Uncharacterized protein n=1 Tax=Fusarium decemcellulare TaxID=57161 RepID=A0ACC1RLY8_9HYPO|nr:hypothetical protein NM208_g13790 [Fusarium decemcellulare]
MVVRQRELVHHIWLDIELPRYPCGTCNRKSSHSLNPQGVWSRKDAVVIGNAICKLFGALRAWKTRHNLTLELNAYSPTDSEHWFKDWYVSTDHEGEYQEQVEPRWDDELHVWPKEPDHRHPVGLEIEKLFHTFDIIIRESLPLVGAVDRLVIRRQLRRCIRPKSLQPIWSRLPRLEEIIYEPWRVWSMNSAPSANKEFQVLVSSGLPKSLKRLSLFEDFNEKISHLFNNPPWSRVQVVRVPNPTVGAALAHKSLDLEQLSVSYMVNAEDFFHTCMPTWTWQHLQSLALTSQYLKESQKHKGISDLLYRAGKVALQMPRLHTFVLWNGTKGNACAFVYQNTGEYPEITWRGTWNLELSPVIVEVWQRLTSEIHSRQIRVKTELIWDDIRSHGDAIHHLNLPTQVVHPASLWQIRREGALEMRGTNA